MTASGHKVITVIVPQGQGMALLERLHARGILRAGLGSARAPLTVVKRRGGIGRTEIYSVEKDVLNVVVAEAEADAMFADLYHAARIGEAHGGFIFQGEAARASQFTLPTDLPQR
jgi:hypothetical protein